MAEKHFPAFRLPTVDGQWVTHQFVRAHNLSLIVFYKRSCHASQLALRLLAGFEVAADISAVSHRLLFVSQDPLSVTRDFLTALNISVPVAIDFPDYALSKQLGFQSVPAFFEVNASGGVENHWEGFDRSLLLHFFKKIMDERSYTMIKKDWEATVPVLVPG